MKIKVFPEDFIVKELADIKYQKGGKYRIYLLTKKHWNTVDALKFISRENNIPMEVIGNAGRKDRHALTFQYISVPREYDPVFDRENVHLEFTGFSNDYISPRVLKGNYFEITLRKIDREEKEKIIQRLKEIKEWGFPNFFDDQRFGSVENEEEFIAEKILKKHYNGALKLYFMVTHPEDKKEERQRKQEIKNRWGDFEAILPLCRTKTEREIIEILKKGKSKENMVKALNIIPKEELSMFFSAYQSYLWNRTLSLILPSYMEDLFPVKGKIMDYLIYRKVKDERKFKELKNLEVPTVSYKIPQTEELVRNAVMEVMKQRGVTPSDFNLKKIRKSFFKSFMRRAVVFPENLYFSGFEEDDFYRGYEKIKLKFVLPPGSFATMLVKSLSLL
ncbi:tRNA pseudouridine(13) synthase TruD [Thermovenabulum sp.]|uniref:tRNA pseudouridine(13) synthase TruD n=1 Tax=Thermovenabulum sp. TaxID=3100335 RepID=UPI003C7CF957